MTEKSASQQVDHIIALHGGWKAELLKQLRSVILQANSNLTEEVKWKMASRPEGLPVWSHQGILCFAEIWKDNVKLLFPNGAQLKNKGIFNARLKGNTIRAIEFHEGDKIDKAGITSLVTAAVAFNQSKR